MCYDYHGQWDKKTGHVAPLYYHPEDDVNFFNTVSEFFKLQTLLIDIFQRLELHNQLLDSIGSAKK